MSSYTEVKQQNKEKICFNSFKEAIEYIKENNIAEAKILTGDLVYNYERE